MIHVYGPKISPVDKRFLKLAAIYTMDYLLPEKGNLVIKVRIGPKTDQDCNGECTYVRRNSFNIWINETIVNRRAKTQLGTYKKLLAYLAHELVHVKQYATGELTYIGSTKYRYRGKIYKIPDENDEDGYYECPDEIEAYGKENHLVTRFVKHWKMLKRDEHI
jgi:hypothetical protein